ncbi:hypothetical protein [Streptomyces abyssomicinicus]|uniref:hypothetical protein n=1 Tax=Streptomyces abyssomicinicus TaxID=574929 RepID=UPI00124FAC37|nr:hypothetical protein [Streptomyces abyssomicinicus]
MGIESDRLVYDYLSRVGDVAQQRQLPSATRMRLVTELRGEIDRRRARTTGDSPATVRRILDRLGPPDAVVAAAGEPVPAQRVPDPPVTPPAPPAPPVPPASAAPAAPEGREAEAEPGPVTSPGPRLSTSSTEPFLAGRLWGLRKSVPKQRADETPASAPTPGARADAGDWWRVDAPVRADEVPGFTGGVEIPEMLKPPPRARGAADGADAAVSPGAGEAAEAGEGAPAAAPARRRRFAWVPRRTAGGGLGSPVLVAAAVLLVAGAVLGQLPPLALGWLIVWASRRLGPGETRWALVTMPGVAVAGGVAWVWGRASGRWGAAIPEGEFAAALTETWPVVLRCAAVLSALYVLHRARRPA